LNKTPLKTTVTLMKSQVGLE